MRRISIRRFSQLQIWRSIAGFFILWTAWGLYFISSSDNAIGVWIVAILLLGLTMSAVRSSVRGTHGFIGRPQDLWELSVVENRLEIQTKFFATEISLEDISSAVISLNCSWDVPMNQERESMLLTLHSGERVRIPGSSNGFGDVKKSLGELVQIETRTFDHDEDVHL